MMDHDVRVICGPRHARGHDAGLENYGVNLVRVLPGGQSSARHTHSKQDEFVYVLEGELVLVTDAGREIVVPSTCIGFPAGTGDGHHFLNLTQKDAVFLVIDANMVALTPSRLSHVEAASAPVIAVTAWQMLFEYGNAKPNQTVMILGAAGNVGAYAVQLAVNAGLQVIGVVGSKDIEYVKALGSQTVVNYQSSKFQNAVRPVDLVLDTVGGETRERSYSVLKSGGVLVLSCPTYAGATRRALGIFLR